MKCLLYTLGLLYSSASLSAGFSLFDDFDDSLLDPALWETSFHDGDSSVIEAGGVLTLSNRGRLITASSVDAPFVITGQFTIAANPADELKITLRTSADSFDSFGDSLNGVTVRLRSDEFFVDDTISVYGASEGYSGVFTPLATGVTYDFKILDTGSAVSVFVDDLEIPMAVLNTVENAGGKAMFYNREQIFSFSTTLDNVSITAIPEPSFLTGMIGTILFVGVLIRRKG